MSLIYLFFNYADSFDEPASSDLATSIELPESKNYSTVEALQALRVTTLG